MIALSPKPEPTKPEPNKLSPEKTNAHIKIASAHLKESEDSSDDPTVSRKDKLLELQNPSKHASESQLLHFLLNQFNEESTDVDTQVDILQNLENFSHKFENGRDLFKATDAVKSILLPALNSSHIEVRSAACGVFAIASQNNNDVQQIVLDFGVIRRLVHLLAHDESIARSKALFALSSVLRNFPAGQKKFVQDGGISALVKVAFSSLTRKRALTLISDLLREIKQCQEDAVIEENNAVPCLDSEIVEASLKSAGWCDVLQNCVQNIKGLDLHDQILTAECVQASLHICNKEFAKFGQLFKHVHDMIKGDEDFGEESRMLQNIMDLLYTKDEL